MIIGPLFPKNLCISPHPPLSILSIRASLHFLAAADISLCLRVLISIDNSWNLIFRVVSHLLVHLAFSGENALLSAEYGAFVTGKMFMSHASFIDLEGVVGPSFCLFIKSVLAALTVRINFVSFLNALLWKGIRDAFLGSDIPTISSAAERACFRAVSRRSSGLLSGSARMFS